MTKPEVTWDWIYWISGFFWCTSLIGYLSFKEQQSAKSAEEAGRAQRGAFAYSLIAIGGFLVFAIRPGLMIPSFGWFLDVVGLQAADSVRSKRIAAPVLEILGRDFAMSEVLAIVKASPDRNRSKAYFRSRPTRFKFLATQEQDPMVLDGYTVEDLASPVVGWSLFYHRANGPLVILDASVNPTNGGALAKAESLIRMSLDSVANPDGSKMYFLGVYDFDASRVLKIMVRKGRTPLGPEYAIRYAVSER